MIDIRLGERLFRGSDPCPMCSSSATINVPKLDFQGWHAFVCPAEMGATRRHNLLRDSLYTFLKKPPLCIQALREQPFASESHLMAHERKRLGVVLDDVRFCERPIGIDVTVVSPHSNAYTLVASTAAGGAASKAEALKEEKYRSLCVRNNIEFVALGIDVFGGMRNSAKRFLRRVSQWLSQLRGTEPAKEYHVLALMLERIVLHCTAVAVNRRRLALGSESNALQQ